MSQARGWAQEAQSQREVVSPTTLTLLQFLGPRESYSHGGGVGSCGGIHLAAPPSPGTFQKPLQTPLVWLVWS